MVYKNKSNMDKVQARIQPKAQNKQKTTSAIHENYTLGTLLDGSGLKSRTFHFSTLYSVCKLSH
jgi:hypothetical protein